MRFDLSGLLQQYLGGNAPSTNDAQAHFVQVAQNASPSAKPRHSGDVSFRLNAFIWSKRVPIVWTSKS